MPYNSHRIIRDSTQIIPVESSLTRTFKILLEDYPDSGTLHRVKGTLF